MSVKSGSNEADRSNSIGLDDLDLNNAIEEVSDDGWRFQAVEGFW